MRRLFAVVALIAAGCAPKGPPPQLVAEAAKAQSLFNEGCYTCLQDALAIYEKHLLLKQPPIGTAERAFDAALLIAVREKDLGIPSSAAMKKALELVVPERMPLLGAADLIIGDTTALDPDQRAIVTGRNRPLLERSDRKRRALDAYPSTDLAAQYVGLSLDCEQEKLIEGVNTKELAQSYAGVPLMQFRLMTCSRAAVPGIATLRSADPRWTDTLYWEGRSELGSSRGRAIDFPKAIGLFALGREAFPKSLMLTMAWANANLAAEEFESALAGFDAVLVTNATHRDALNGRMQSLSYLMRHDEAIAAATRLLDLGTWHIGDANYWRAWNRYQLKQYDPAWVDVENATRGLSNARVYMLAGLIAYARKELPVAIDRFDRAFTLDNSACDAVWMSGLVSIDQNELAAAAPKFTRSMTCFVSATAALRQDAAGLEAAIEKRGTPASAREQRLIEKSKKDADNAEEKAAQSAFNAAQCYARTGKKTMALTHVDVAIAHPLLREKALALKAAIEKLPN
jgi:tetratricopeptide (TPR) repeat protein